MSDEEDIAALVIDNGSGMCKGMCAIIVVLWGLEIGSVLWWKLALRLFVWWLSIDVGFPFYRNDPFQGSQLCFEAMATDRCH
jgi:hypothetical protein